ncbi:hypothetical protein [Micromonospora sp. KC213]|uniref:hypothetical protein n=1 Tax=Micromonospora sp. KC213 TaxID=2530378 RepID=UPI00105374D0|nr:hypothetical protein [Micromonospora sp. KC213]TDC44063.1 hypothetical protein E1166_00730 [Micromonospora sp. KC213]
MNQVDMSGAEGPGGAGPAVQAHYAYERSRDQVLAWLNGDRALAEERWRAAAADGDGNAAEQLAMFYLRVRDRGEALPLLQQAAEAGHYIAAFTYAELLAEDGQQEAARRMYRLSAEYGYVPAQAEMGARALAAGDLDMAEEMLVLAAGQGSARAMSDLAVLLASRGEAADAEELWSAAATSGWADAAHHLVRQCESAGDRSGVQHWTAMAEMGGYAGPQRMTRPPASALRRLDAYLARRSHD